MAQMIATQQQGSAEKSTALPDAIVTLDDFDTLFLTFQPRIISFIITKVGNREQAYDLTQDTFTKAFQALRAGAIVYKKAFSSWIHRIAYNTTIDLLRRRRVIAWVPLSVFTDDRNIGAGMPNEPHHGKVETDEMAMGVPVCPSFSYSGGLFENRLADREIIHHILWERMEAKYSLCLWLYEHDGLSCTEIGEMLNISISATKMRLTRARQQFAEFYQKESEEE